MAKRILVAIMWLFLIAVKGYATNRYVSTSGNDGNNGLTPGTAYATLGKATSVAINGDDIIIAAGTYTQAATQCVVAVGVDIIGAGQFAGGTKIILTFSVSGANTFNSTAIQLVSASLNTPGNQSITGIWFDGNNFNCLSGILIRSRGNVTVQNCKFTNFGITAVNLNGKLANQTGVPPSTFSTGNQVINCSFTDCSDRITQSANSVSCGSISYSGQSNLLFQYDTLSNTGKGLGHNGNLFGAVQGNNKGVRWLNNIMTKPLEQNDGYNFGIESWYDQGGCEFAFNTYVGGGNVIDVGYGGANKGSDAYSWYVHDNLWNNPTLTNYVGNSGTTGAIFVQFEPTTFVDNAGSFRVGSSYTIVSTGTTSFTSIGAANNNPGTVFTATGVGAGTGRAAFAQNATIGNATIEDNYLKNAATLVQIVLNNFSLDFIDNININHNVGEEMGYSNTNAFGAPIIFTVSSGVRINNVLIDNNTLVGTMSPTGVPKSILMLQPNVGVISNIYFRNNIAMNTIGGYGYLVFRGNKACNTIFSQNNITFQNAFSNNPYTLVTSFNAGNFIVGNQYRIASAGSTVWTSIGAANNNPGTVFTATGAGTGNGIATTEIPPINFTNTGNIKSDPIFISSTSPVNYHLGTGSPGIGTGLNPPEPALYIGAYPPGTITPTITWNNPSAITYGTALSGTQLNATSGGVPGTFAYTPAAGTVLNAGTQTLNVVFTPTDQNTYSVVSKSVTIVVNKATATLAYSNLTQTYTGTPLQPTVTTTPAGLTVVNTTYNGLGTIPTTAGTYTVVSGLTNANYTASTITNTFTISKAAATINVSNTSQTYDGTSKVVTASTSPVGLSGLIITYNGSGIAPINSGSYAVQVTLANPNYTATPVNTTLVISKATPTVSWSNPTAITYGTALSGTQLNATASVAGSFAYTPASGTVLNAGSNVLSVNFTPTDAANYNSVLNTTVTIIVNKAVATITLSNLAQTYDGTQKSAIATTSPVGLNTITITYNGSSTAPTAAGTYAVVASLSNANYTATNATGNLVISKATAILSLSNTTYNYDGTPKSVTVTTAPAGLTVVSVTYNGSGTPPTNAGTYTVVATLNNANYQGSVSGTLTINKGTPVITWTNPSAIIYGTALSGTQLNASSNVAGSFAYTPASGTILNAGTYTLIADFTPTDGANYNSVNGTSVSLTVNKATATITLSNLNQTYDGNPKPVTVTTNPVGLGVITTTYNGSATVPSAVGSYTVNSSLVNTNYTASPATGTLVISASAANIYITNINQTYTGSPLPVTVTTSPPSLAHTVTYNGSATVPTNAGTYTVIATLNSPNVGADTQTYIIAKANPVITWGNPSAITYGTALSGTQLNATASVAGAFTYTPVSGTILNAGTQNLSVSFVPTDAANYNSIPVSTVTIVVNKAVATITISNTSQVFDGTPKSVTVTTSPVGLATITTTYNGSTTAPSAVGTYVVVSSLSNSNYTATPANDNLVITATAAGISISNTNQTYTSNPLPVTVTTNPSGLPHTVTYNGSATVPTNSGTYTVIATLTGGTYTGADTQTLVINKATPVITWPNPASISYGIALSITQLNATSGGVAGTFVYNPVSGTVLNVGTQSLSVTFTPTDGSNYNVVTKVVSITVTGTSATLTLSNLSQTYNGSPRSVIVTTSPLGLSGVTILYNGSSVAPTNAGSYTINVTLVNTNYTAAPITGTLVIAKALPILSWVLPQQITYGTALSNVQLNATANVAGTFTYVPAAGTILNPGTSALVATFNPTDLVNYMNNTTIIVPLSVSGASFLNWYLTHGATFYDNLPGQNPPPP